MRVLNLWIAFILCLVTPGLAHGSITYGDLNPNLVLSMGPSSVELVDEIQTTRYGTGYLNSKVTEDIEKIREIINSGPEDQVECKKELIRFLADKLISYQVTPKLQLILDEAKKQGYRPELRLAMKINRTEAKDASPFYYNITTDVYARIYFIYGNQDLHGLDFRHPLMVFDFDGIMETGLADYGHSFSLDPNLFEIKKLGANTEIGSCNSLKILNDDYKMYRSPLFEVQPNNADDFLKRLLD